jgi:23S rRNA (cytosine1962-C5)-methyltransferase
VEGGATAGDEVSVVDPRGNLLGRGFYSPGSAIPVRIMVRDEKTRLDASFFRTRLERAVAHRAALGLPSEQTSGFRQAHAEGDGLPGLIVDRLGDVLSVQLATIGMKQREALVHEALTTVVAPRAIVDRTSAQIAKAEGFEPSAGVVRGDGVRAFEFVERGLRFRVPLELGQKTGFYFDQRSLRARVEQLAHGKRVLDAYSFVGAFAIAAARGGAREVVAVDESALAIEVGAECAAINGVGDRVKFVKGDARRSLAEARGEFDMVVVDPPRLAPTRGARDQALVAYAKLAENACRATRPGGLLVVCSCSAAVDLAALTRALATGAAKVNTEATVLERWFQGADHPVPAAFGEGLYLKAVIARVDARA